MKNLSDEQRLVPRFPLPKEKIKFIFEDGEKIFAVRDISSSGLGISLLEFGESTFFPVGYLCQAELKLSNTPFVVNVRVARANAWSVGFIFENLDADHQRQIQDYIDPLHLASSLRLVEQQAAPEAFLQGMHAWYHGDSGTDIFLWNDARGGLSRALVCLGKKFWEWSDSGGVSTGEIERSEGDKVILHRDATPDARTRGTIRKMLEHTSVLEYRLVNLLKEHL